MKRVLLIESGRFIGGVIHNLFLHQEQFCVIEAAPSSERALLRAVEQHQPQIVILDDTLRVEYLAHLLTYMQLRSENMSIVVVNTDHNGVELYEKQHIHVQGAADLFAVL